MVRSLLASALLLGLVTSCSGSVARQVDDTESLIQRATAVLEKPKDQGASKTAAMPKEAKLTDTAKVLPTAWSEEDPSSAETRRRLQEQVTAFLKEVPGLPMIVSGTAKHYVVPQVMMFRDKADDATRKLLDGIVAMDMWHKNLTDLGVLSETLLQLSTLYEQVGHSYVASALRNQSILLPPFLASAPKLLAVQQTTTAAVLHQLQPLLEAFVKEIEPIVKQTLSDIAPHAKRVAEQVSQAIGGTLQNATVELQRDESFGALKEAVKLVSLGNHA